MTPDERASRHDRFLSAIRRNIEKSRLAGNERAAVLYEEFLSNQIELNELMGQMRVIATKDIPEEDQRQQMIDFFPNMEANSEKLRQIVEALKLAGE